MKAMIVFMVSWLVFVSVLVGISHPVQAVGKKDCCLYMGKGTSCPHQKQNCGHGLCNTSICCSYFGFMAVSSLPVKVCIPFVKSEVINRYLNRNLPMYSDNFWHPPQV